MRIAVLILASHAPRALAATARYFEDANADLFVHVDARTDFADYLKNAGPPSPRVRFLEARRRVYWAGFSMVEATLDLLREARRAGPYERYIFISDNCLPVQSLDGMFARLAAAEDMIVCYKTLAEDAVRAYYDKFYLIDGDIFDWRRGGGAPQAVDAGAQDQLARLLALKARGKRPLELFHGQASWVLAPDSVEIVLAAADNDPWLMESCRFASNADEIFFSSLVGAAKYPNGTSDSPSYSDGFRYAPRVIRTARDLPLDMHPHFLFLRKIAPDFEPGLPETCLRLYGGLRHMLANDPGVGAERVIALGEGAARHLHLFAPIGNDPDWGGLEVHWGRRHRRLQGAVSVWRMRAPAPWPAVRLTLVCVGGAGAHLPGAFFEIDGQQAPLIASDIGFSAEFQNLARPFDTVAFYAPQISPPGALAVAVIPKA